MCVDLRIRCKALCKSVCFVSRCGLALSFCTLPGSSMGKGGKGKGKDKGKDGGKGKVKGKGKGLRDKY